ncbi:MAG: Lipid 4-amino-4-deoxy-L-arabinosyltransferase [Bacteroidota bacterium]|jgi:4-amino-4-deoxy-L-arabinose transferase-like glycosyltransferase
MKILQRSPYLFWVLVGCLVYIPFLGSSQLFDWDEINFAESAREMLVTGDYLSVQINFQPFWEKPPVFMWLQVLSFQFFGTFTENAWTSMEFAARFPNALVGIATLLTLFRLGKKHVSESFGHLWAFSYLAAMTPHVYASSGIIDPLFNLFIFLGIYCYSQFYTQPHSIRWSIYAGLCIGMGMLTKGPVALLLWGATLLVFGIWQQVWKSKPISRLLLGACLSGILAVLLFASWYAMIILKFGWGIWDDFVAYQIRLMTTGDAGHGQPVYYHVIVLLLGCLPISIWAGARLLRRKSSEETIDLSRWMQVLFWVVLVVFSLVKTKIIHYSSMCWIPLTYFSAQVLTEFQLGQWTWKRSYSFALGIVGLLFGVVLTLVPLIGMYAAEASVYIQDAFVQGNLQAPVYWAGWEWLIGFGFVGLIAWTILRKQITYSVLIRLMMGSVMVMMCFMAVVLPKIAGYTQATPIDFYVSHVGQKVYIETVGFKSFAHLLYFQKQGPSPDGESLMKKSSTDRPSYFVMKSDAEDRFKYHPHLQLIKEENGFLFYKHVN